MNTVERYDDSELIGKRMEGIVAKFGVYLGMCLKGLKEMRNISVRIVLNLAKISVRHLK